MNPPANQVYSSLLRCSLSSSLDRIPSWDIAVLRTSISYRCMGPYMSLSRRATAFPPWQLGSHPILHRIVDGVLFSPVVRNAQSAYSNLHAILFDHSGHWQHLTLFKRRVWFVKGNRSDFACHFPGGLRMSWILCSQKATDRALITWYRVCLFGCTRYALVDISLSKCFV